ncbi:MAG: hypothetical protein OEL87_03525 [Nanoarchaeota archaeon]|nr:hypothetical protein [Nanoarchaeota archaeon]
MAHKPLEIEADFSVEDILGNGRIMLKFSFNKEIRERLYLLNNMNCVGEVSPVEFYREMGRFGVDIIEDKSKYFGHDYFYDCQEWAFDKVGLPQYTSREGDGAIDFVLRKDLPGISWVPPVPLGDAIAVYFNGHVPTHFGVVVVQGDEILIDSKWGRGNVYRHSPEKVPLAYGDYIGFFKVGD